MNTNRLWLFVVLLLLAVVAVSIVGQVYSSYLPARVFLPNAGISPR